MEILDREAIINKIRNSEMKFAWINTYSDLRLIQLDNKSNVEEYFDNLIEAKFFNEDKEISVVEAEEDVFSVYEFNGCSNKDFIVEEQILSEHKSPFKDENKSSFKGKFNKLIIRHYLEYDDEGQAYVSYTKLCNVKRGEIANE